MSNTMQKNISQRKQVKSAIERIEHLELELGRMVMAINDALGSHGKETRNLAAILEAVVELFGADTVDAQIKVIADRKALKSLEDAQKALAKGIADGEVVPGTVIGDNSLIVGRELEANGNVVFPGKAQLTFKGVKPEFQEKLKGLGAGSTIETKDGGKFEVLEVFDIVEKKTPAPTAPEAPQGTPQDPAAAAVPALTEAEVAALEQALTPSEG